MEENKYTKKTLEVISESQKIAIKNGNPEVTDLHLHMALVQGDSYIREILNLMDVETGAYIREVGSKVASLPRNSIKSRR